MPSAPSLSSESDEAGRGGNSAGAARMLISTSRRPGVVERAEEPGRVVEASEEEASVKICALTGDLAGERLLGEPRSPCKRAKSVSCCSVRGRS